MKEKIKLRKRTITIGKSFKAKEPNSILIQDQRDEEKQEVFLDNIDAPYKRFLRIFFAVGFMLVLLVVCLLIYAIIKGY